MTQPAEESINEKLTEKVANEFHLLEPKEEQLYDFSLGSTEKETMDFPKEPKDEPLDLCDSYPTDAEIPQLNFIGEDECKKEEMQDFGDIFSHDGVAMKSEKNDMSPLIPDEPKLEVLEDRVVIAVENPNGLQFSDDIILHESTIVENNIRRRGSKSNDEELASSSGLPFTAQDIFEMSTIDIKQLLKSNLFSDSQLDIIRNIRKRGQQRARRSNTKEEGVIRMWEGEEHELIDTSFATPQCIFCEKYPSTMHAYISHLYLIHNSTLKLNQLYLLCSCGAEVHSTFRDLNHSKKCAGIEFTLHKLEEEAISTPQCIICEKYPSTIYAYVNHLHYHKSSLIKNGIFLRCSCGLDVKSGNLEFEHKKKCAGTDFSIVKVENTPIPSTPQCILCEMYPSTAYAYALHLVELHQSSLIEQGIFLQCLCGVRICSSTVPVFHNTGCDARKFTLNKIV